MPRPPKGTTPPALDTRWGRTTPVADPKGHRRLVAAHVERHGPAFGDVLAAAVGLSPEEFWVAVDNCPWFRLTGPGYHLTPLGQQEANR